MDNTVQANVIKRSAIAIIGTVTIETNATNPGDTIHATKTLNGWTMLNRNTGKYYQCFTDFLRRFVIISEQITA